MPGHLGKVDHHQGARLQGWLKPFPSQIALIVANSLSMMDRNNFFQDNSDPTVDEGKNKSKGESSSRKETFYKRRVLEKQVEESSSRGEIFQRGEKSKLRIEDVSLEDPRKQEINYNEVEPIIEEAKEEEENLPSMSPLSSQRKESVIIEELLDDISEKQEKETSIEGCHVKEKETVHTEADIALGDIIGNWCRFGEDLQKMDQQKERLDDISEGEDKSEEKMIEESKLKEEKRTDMASSLNTLETKSDISVSKQENVANEEKENVKMIGKSPKGAAVVVVDVDEEKDGREEVKEYKMDKINIGSCVKEIGLVGRVKLLDNTDKDCSKEYSGSLEREIIHGEANVALRCKEGEMAVVAVKAVVDEEEREVAVKAEEELFVSGRTSLTLVEDFADEGLKSCNNGGRLKEISEENAIVRRLVKDYGEDAEEDSDRFEHQVG